MITVVAFALGVLGAGVAQADSAARPGAAATTAAVTPTGTMDLDDDQWRPRP